MRVICRCWHDNCERIKEIAQKSIRKPCERRSIDGADEKPMADSIGDVHDQLMRGIGLCLERVSEAVDQPVSMVDQ